MLQAIIIVLKGIAGVERGVNIDALDFVCEVPLQSFESQQVVTLDEEVVALLIGSSSLSGLVSLTASSCTRSLVSKSAFVPQMGLPFSSRPRRTLSLLGQTSSRRWAILPLVSPGNRHSLPLLCPTLQRGVEDHPRLKPGA